jgi:mono/diheme cytochrome c family protein
MKKISIIAFLTAAVIIVSCSDVKRKPNSTYMPDMAYSRAYETYADHHELKDSGINYTNMPVTGTIARDEEMPFPYAKDAIGDTAAVNYKASMAAVSPIDSMSAAGLVEAERIYLINCGICHGKNLDGNGPLYKDGTGPYPAAPKNLIADPIVSKMPAGQMFYSITYGKGMMGSYASQLNRKQRWEIIYYIQQKQLAAKAAASAAEPAATATK